jgi:hypothetical protein
MNEKTKKQKPQNPDKCVNRQPGLKCKGTARLDKANKIAGFTLWGRFLHRLVGFMQPVLLPAIVLPDADV